MPVVVDKVSRRINPTRLLLSQTRALLLKIGAAPSSLSHISTGPLRKLSRLARAGVGTKLSFVAAGTARRSSSRMITYPTNQATVHRQSKQVSIVCSHLSLPEEGASCSWPRTL
jgi:hypothetical protein